MFWPPKVDDLKPSRAKTIFHIYLMSFLLCLILENRSTVGAVRQKKQPGWKSLSDKILLFLLRMGLWKFQKSVLFPSVVKALCNNIEVVKLINKYGHGVSYDLVEEIETEYM